MDIIKYFYEEPALLETLTPDHDPDARRRSDRTAEAGGTPSRQALEAFLSTPDYYRGYLAGANRDTGNVGLTAIAHPEAFVQSMLEGLGAGWWAAASDDGSTAPLDVDAVRQTLRDPSDTAVLVTAAEPIDLDLLTATVGTRRRYALPALRRLLDAAHVAFFPEPAHDGFDWSFFSAHPLREKLTEAFKQNPAEDVRRFALPYQKARSEHKFYFETWQLSAPSLPDYIEEV